MNTTHDTEAPQLITSPRYQPAAFVRELERHVITQAIALTCIFGIQPERSQAIRIATGTFTVLAFAYVWFEARDTDTQRPRTALLMRLRGGFAYLYLLQVLIAWYVDYLAILIPVTLLVGSTLCTFFRPDRWATSDEPLGARSTS